MTSPEPVKWGQYPAVPPSPVVGRPHHELSQAEARQAFDELMTVKEERKSAIRRLLATNGAKSKLETNEEWLAFEGWIIEKVLASTSGLETLEDRWFVVGQDAGLQLGDVLISRTSGLEWRMLERPPSDMSFQRPVITGFAAAYPGFSFDPMLAVTQVAMAAAARSDGTSDVLVTQLSFMEETAVAP